MTDALYCSATSTTNKAFSLPNVQHSQRSLFEVLKALFHSSISQVRNLGDNDIYKWYMANSSPPSTSDTNSPPDLKINLIWPCTAQHIRKYSAQTVRMVTETPQIYRDYIRPYMQQKREEGKTKLGCSTFSRVVLNKKTLYFATKEPTLTRMDF